MSSDNQANLFDHQYAGTTPRVRGSRTSEEAGDSTIGSARSKRREVYSFICTEGGATDEEMQEALDMAPNTQRPRRRELVLSGAIRDSGRTRPTRSNRKAVVWVATEAEK